MRIRQTAVIARFSAFLALSWALSGPAVAEPPPAERANLVVNPDFSKGTEGWSGLWTRDAGKGRAEVVARGTEAFPSSLLVEHRGEKDWSFQQADTLPAVPGEIYRYSGRISFVGAGLAELSVILYDREKKVMDWSFALTGVKNTRGWKAVDRKFLVPPGAAGIRFRLTGSGQGTTLCTGLRLEQAATAPAVKEKAVSLVNAKGTVRFDPADGHLTLRPAGQGLPVVFENFRDIVMPGSLKAKGKTGLVFSVFNAYGDDARGELALLPDGSVLFTLQGSGPMEDEVRFPGPWRASAGTQWVIPENEGLLIPADDPHYNIQWGKTFYSGHGFCLPFVGLTDGERGAVLIVETPDDAGVRFTRPAAGALSAFSLTWQSELGRWGYERRFQVRFPPRGGYVGVAKAFRAYVKEKGRLVTLKDKAKTAPDALRLPGCVDLWYWKDGAKWWGESDPRAVAGEMHDAGLRRVLWSSEARPEAVAFLNGLGFITGRYDIYQDVYPPDSPGWLAKLNAEAWPDSLTLDRYGDRISGWIHRENGREYKAGVVCSQPGLEMLKAHVAQDLRDHPYRARFIDTTTASPLRECWHPNHPLSRGADRRYKSLQLEHLSKERGLVTGSETGVDWAVPFLHYFEGMMSLGDYRLPDAGYDLWSVKAPPEGFLRFQVGPYYRIPLFELVYHDCVASFPYWGDASNRLADWWEVRDLFSALYGTGPLWIVDEARWKKNRERFVRSYERTTAVAARTAGIELLEHSFLNADHSVQSTRFADGTRVWTNFGKEPYRLPDGRLLAPLERIIDFP